MRKKLRIILAFFCLLALLIPTAAAADPPEGTVIFAQRYADFTDLRETGIRVGTAGGTPEFALDGALQIGVRDDRKAYLILPELPEDGAWCNTYTAEYAFRFTDVKAANGYFGFLVTSLGDGPSNRTEVILRAAGTCDGIGDLSEEFTSAMQAGETVYVSVPVRLGMMYELRLRCGDVQETLPMPAVKTVGKGSRGFVLRSASVEVESVVVVSGTEYDEKLGPYAFASYRAEIPAEEAPPTADGLYAVLPAAILSGAGLLLLRRRRVRA